MSHIKYYVDESGDLALFNKRGVPLSTSKTIMLGLLKVKEKNFEEKFLQFKNKIDNDPIFNIFPSFEKTKENFHAKDDHIAVKREMFLFIKNLNISVQAVIRRRSSLIEYARSIYENYNKKYTQKEIYHDLMKRLFKENLHKEGNYEIFFSHRGNTTDNKSLTQALNESKERFYKKWQLVHSDSNSTYSIACKYPHEEPGLQIIDYCLWALQRLYEKQDPIYYALVEDKFKLIIDVDDKANKQYGEYYNKSNKLTLEKIRG